MPTVSDGPVESLELSNGGSAQHGYSGEPTLKSTVVELRTCAMGIWVTRAYQYRRG